MPGGAAVCGRADVTALLHLKPGDAEWNRHRHVIHRGTWNGNPVTAAAAVAVLNIAARGEIQKYAESMAARLVLGVNREIENGVSRLALITPPRWSIFSSAGVGNATGLSAWMPLSRCLRNLPTS